MSFDLKSIRMPHVFVLLLSVIFISSLLSYIIPSGEFIREEKVVAGLKKTLVIPGTYSEKVKHYSLNGIFLDEEIEGKSTPVSLMGFLTAVPKGMEEAADIIFFIFIIGGVFGILQRTGTIIAFLQKLLKIFGNKPNILIIVLMITIGVAASTLGMGEELLPLIPLFLVISKQLGYDRIMGVAIVWLSAEIGFAAATTNPYTVQIAQNLAQVPLNSGIIFRIVFFAVTMSIGIWYLLNYGKKVKADMKNSAMPDDEFLIDDLSFEEVHFTNRHLTIILTGILLFGFIIYSVQNFGWWINEMSGAFLLLGILCVVISGMSIKSASDSFIKGMEEMVVAALVVGFARGVQVVLLDGQILDTIINSAANNLQGLPKFVAAGGMLIFQTTLNFFIPSGSGQAAVTMPLMAPLADLIGITRQTAVFAFTCGDGFSNMVIPTSGILMAVLSLAKIPFTNWLKFVAPIFLVMIMISFIFLSIAVYINY